MNPITVQILSEAEKRRHSEQIEALQLLNHFGKVRSGRLVLLEALMDCLGTALKGAKLRLREQTFKSGSQLPGKAQ
ncbi:MAG TPA: hypothetical protein VLY63_20385 [Anaerolineae bacterium]|nr:hypothetical protein [Anaerolineae bacterium]